VSPRLLVTLRYSFFYRDGPPQRLGWTPVLSTVLLRRWFAWKGSIMFAFVRQGTPNPSQIVLPLTLPFPRTVSFHILSIPFFGVWVSLLPRPHSVADDCLSVPFLFLVSGSFPYVFFLMLRTSSKVSISFPSLHSPLIAYFNYPIDRSSTIWNLVWKAL